MTYTEEELLDALRAFAAESGHPPTAPEVRRPVWRSRVRGVLQRNEQPPRGRKAYGCAP